MLPPFSTSAMAPVSNRRLVLAPVIIAVLVAVTTGALVGKSRQRRNTLQMCQMVTTYTDRSCFHYYNYGCYCGVGNADSDPVDDVDRCCQAHDACYGTLKCYWVYPAFVYYRFQCNRGHCSCSGSRFFSSCIDGTCKCDLQLARCLGQARYDDSYKYYSRSLCTTSGR